MKEVKIYTIVSDQLSPPITGESFCTDMVRHSDYAELEAKYVALALRDNMRQSREKLEAAERSIAELDQRLIEYAGIATREARRVAELEARKVNLSKLSVGEVMHMSGFSRDYAEGWCAGNDNAIHEIRTAGLKVKES